MPSAQRIACRQTGRENPAQKDQLTQFNINIRQYTDSLKSLGMGEAQIKEMIRARRYMEDIDITAPADGFIIARNISQGQRFDKGTELYRIGDSEPGMDPGGPVRK